MSLDNCYRAYGLYLVTYNRLGPLLDAAIVRESGLQAVTGAIVVSGLNPKSRLAVLRGLLAATGGEKADAVPLLAEIAQDLKKQPLLQGTALPGGTNSLLFLRQDTGARPGAGSVELTAEAIDAAAAELAGRIDALAEALAIRPGDMTALKRAQDDLTARRRRTLPAAMEDDLD